MSEEARIEETPYGRYVTSDGWFVHNLQEALAVRFQQGGALYPLEPQEAPFRDLGVNMRVLWPGDANALNHHEDAQDCTAEARLFHGVPSVNRSRCQQALRV